MKLYVYSMRDFDELSQFEKYCEKYNVEWAYTNETPSMENLNYAKGYDVVDIITTVINKDMIDRWHELGVKCIATRTIGYDHIDSEYAKKIGMGVVNITYSPASVADYTVMMMLMGCRRIKHIMERAAVQDFSLKGKLGTELHNASVGIIGTGRIGRTVIDELSGFGCKIYAYDIYESDEVRKKASYVSLDELYEKCDIISLHAPLTTDNYHMIDKTAIDKMKQGVMLINCARGQLIDTQALIDGIESGKVGFAGLDVIEQESGLYYFNRMGEPLGNPQLAILKSYPNVVVTPHTAFYTDEAVANMVENSIICAKNFVDKAADKYYLLVHFIGDFPDGEQIYFSVSRDGFHWNDLNGGKPVLRSEIGEKGARDPFILRSHDGGKFYIIATDLRIATGKGWQAAQFEGSRSLLVWESEDLVNWSEASLNEVAIEGAGCVWAPEAVYDEEKGEYMVFWASMVKEKNDDEGKHRIYCSYTKDFKTFSNAVKYIERPQSVIDTTIVYDGGRYYRFSKDETAKTIQLDAGENLQGEFHHVKSETLDHLLGVEGPACYPLPDTKGWCLIVDRFLEGKGYLPVLCSDLSTGDFKIAPDDTYDMGETRKRHGSVLVISGDEYDRLINKYAR